METTWRSSNSKVFIYITKFMAMTEFHFFHFCIIFQNKIDEHDNSIIDYSLDQDKYNVLNV